MSCIENHFLIFGYSSLGRKKEEDEGESEVAEVCEKSWA